MVKAIFKLVNEFTFIDVPEFYYFVPGTTEQQSGVIIKHNSIDNIPVIT